MLHRIINTLLMKSVTRDGIKMTLKIQDNKSIIKEKLGVDSIDEFMKKDYHSEQL